MSSKSILRTLAFLIALTYCVNLAYPENIDPNDDDSQYAYGENVGWVNFEPAVPAFNVGATVSDDKVTGFIWAENIGWINLSPASYGGVLNDGVGNLSGYAWAENVGWINLRPAYGGVTIDDDGNFEGWAWGENIGWIHLRSDTPVAYGVTTSWTPNYPLCWGYLTQCHGDVDNTGDVKGWDFLALKDSWYKVYPDPDYDPCADFDRNGEVKGSDFLILKNNWYQTVPPDCTPGGVWPP
ncbi:MAG: dockerin type I domain-containing protein [Planctomycetota bacterium]